MAKVTKAKPSADPKPKATRTKKTPKSEDSSDDMPAKASKAKATKTRGDGGKKKKGAHVAITTQKTRC